MEILTSAGVLYTEPTSGRSLHYPGQFYKDEPETIRWLDELPADDVLWDIGANIGIFALYAAKTRGMQVLAFEPSAASYAALVRNVEINLLGDCITTYCLAFDRISRLDQLQMMETEAGYPLHMFGSERTLRFGQTPTFRQSVIGFTIDRFCELFRPLPPAHIKLDVDGIEPEVIEGGAATLAAHTKTLLVEIEDPERGHRVHKLLGSLGFSEDTSFAASGSERNALFRRAGWSEPLSDPRARGPVAG